MISAYVLITVVFVSIAIWGLVFYGARGQRDTGPNSCALPTTPRHTVLDRSFSSAVDSNPGKSGLRIISNDFEAFEVRLELAQNAGRSLDLQYYYWKSDVTGRILIREVLAAADRGVRVRVLLDDINSMGHDPTYLALNTHANIEVRLFNPSRSRESPIRRGLELVLRYFSATRRMHNKCWIADGRVVLVGGRNIGDAYFGAATTASYRDIDVMIVGSAVKDATRIFDSYWNSDAALPVTSLHRIWRGKLAKLRYRLAQHAELFLAKSYVEKVRIACRTSRFLEPEKLEWVANVEVVADSPEKARADLGAHGIANRIFGLYAEARHELTLCSPYFIPGADGMTLLRDVSRRVAKVSVFTNSLAATDVMIVHSAYAKYRKELLECGIALYEQKASIRRSRISLFGARTASLHTKACIADRRLAFVGSFNLDPRSKSINTEMGVIFDSEVLSTDLAQRVERQIRDGYELTWQEGRLVWRENSGSAAKFFTSEPGSSRTRRLNAWIMGLLPIESQL